FNTNPKPGLPRNVDTLRLRVENIKRYAIDNLVVIDFSSDFSKITGGEFVKMLTHLCEPLAVVVGFDFRCGNPKDAATAEDLHNLFLENNRDVSVLIKQAILTEGGEEISSTLVRRVIDNGEVGCIPMLTGQNYRVDLATNKAALTKGVLELCRTSIHQLLPQDGVYETRILFADGSEGEGTCMLEGESLKVQLGFSKDEAHANGTEYDGKQLDSIYFLEKRK
ncbi:MAG: hypothetical protein KBS81_03010, partial [Spirochaetales bacterium]|nr:hypothetical protein [Candidatus Physcosoma equi]